MSKEAARDVFRMWHRGRAPDQVFTDDVEFPDVMPMIGVALEILYWSDKFARRCLECGKITEDKTCHGKTERAVGEFELYRHDCDSHAPVYAPTSKPDSGKRIEVKRENGRIPVTQLAFMDSIVVKMNDGRRVVQDFAFGGKQSTPLYCMTDKKTLIIPWTRRPLIVTGSNMKITAHGIVH